MEKDPEKTKGIATRVGPPANSTGNLDNRKKHQYHLRIVGKVGAGKSALIRRINVDEFCPDYNYASRIYCDWLRKEVTTDTTECDTAGQERFGRLHSGFYGGAHCVCVVYDITDMTSFEGATEWLLDAARYVPNAVKFLVGNKCDLDSRIVSSAAASGLAESFEAQYFEVSAASGKNVSELLTAIATMTHSRFSCQPLGVVSENVDVTQKKSSYCY
ncbi:Rab family GTPase [Aspergillus lucknowensis]|uniref:P-loop containing nucleoside triphosphate hydrolase protein n=1 Tax=Aspergillus lucknowensis TaxID=176173 RepID=A0ABR4LX75_9EURO